MGQCPSMKPSFPDSRADRSTVLPLVLQMAEFVNVIPHIANGWLRRLAMFMIPSSRGPGHGACMSKRPGSSVLPVPSMRSQHPSEHLTARKWAGRRYAFTLDNRTVWSSRMDGLLGIKQAHMLHYATG
jgi:hypothetical protein